MSNITSTTPASSPTGPPTPNYPDPVGGASFIVAWRAKSQTIVVVGGGPIAAGRVFNSLEADAHVIVVSPALCPELQYRHQKSQITWYPRKFDAQKDLQEIPNISLVLTAIDDPEASREIVAECRSRRIPVNAADMNDLCDFWFMSMHRDRSVQIAVSTNAKAPKLANRIRRIVAGSLPKNTGVAVDKIGALRKRIRQSDPDPKSSKRRMVWLSQLCEYWPIEELAKLGQNDYDELLDAYLNNTDPTKVAVGSNAPDTDSKDNNKDNSIGINPSASSSTSTLLHQPQQLQPGSPPSPSTANGDIFRKEQRKPTGSITLVGAGLGDPDLLTIKAKKAIETADYIISDKLVPSPILNLVPPSTELYIARKFPGMANAAQQDIIAKAISQLEKGKRVVRLKQGDPFVYGRGGEEVIEFSKHGYQAEVVPGLSSAFSGPALCGIPVTHRGVADQVLVLSGSNKEGQLPNIPPFLATRTLVILMSVKRLEPLVDMLLLNHPDGRGEGGKTYPGDLPVAMVERAGCSDQRTVRATLETIVEVVKRVGSNPPGLIVIGYAVNVLVKASRPSSPQQTDTAAAAAVEQKDSLEGSENSGGAMTPFMIEDKYQQASLGAFYPTESATTSSRT
ncbi:uroporphyrin-III C-methyltransferase [Mycoemilia scoparia]|uniref:Uroporphyrin-III C-methyltransferase n=1 Tax=Mycoemilia scoparia TaxID=417184 RepID=A0A9W7ZKQ1_9FUNG|nr:uroporphyrin-III C-methyltransferase [Mycoemilia scoparia]